MKLSTRNALEGKVESVRKGEVVAMVKIKMDYPTTLTAIVTAEAIDELELKPGDRVKALVKSTSVIVTKE